MKVLVTGGAGFIGSHLCEELLKQGHHVIVIDNLSTGRLQNIEGFIDDKRFQFLKGDLGDREWLKEIDPHLNQCDLVFHLAGLADIVPSIQRPSDYYDSNVTATVNLLEHLRNWPQLRRIVYAASSSCYGIPKQFPTKEDAAIRPEYPYALTKRLGEEVILHWSKVYDLPATSLRLFNVYGPRSRTSGTYGAVFGVFLAQKLAKKPFTIVGDGNQTRDFTFVSDVVNAFITAGLSSDSNGVFNVGSGHTYSVNKLCELLQGEKTHIPKRPGEPDCTFADICKIQKVLDWRPQVSLEEGVKILLENIEYWREAPVWTPETIAEETKEWFKSLD